jgi:hypothetical protein
LWQLRHDTANFAEVGRRAAPLNPKWTPEVKPESRNRSDPDLAPRRRWKQWRIHPAYMAGAEAGG